MTKDFFDCMFRFLYFMIPFIELLDAPCIYNNTEKNIQRSMTICKITELLSPSITQFILVTFGQVKL